MDDEKIYNAILDELRESGPRQGLWAKCFTEANGNENAAKALYFKYRAQQLSNQETPTANSAATTDLSKHIAPSEKIVSQPTQKRNGLLFLGIFLISISIWKLFESNEKHTEIPKVIEFTTINSGKNIPATQPNENPWIYKGSSTPTQQQTQVLNAIPLPDAKIEIIKETPKPSPVEAKVSAYEIAGRTIEKELAENLHLFKYKLNFGGELHYSKDEKHFYPLNYKYSNAYADDTTVVASIVLVGDQTKNQPNIILYGASGWLNKLQSYCFRNKNDDLINCFHATHYNQKSKIQFKDNFLEIKYNGFSKNDSFAGGGSIPVYQKYEYINGELICTAGQCNFKEFE